MHPRRSTRTALVILAVTLGSGCVTDDVARRTDRTPRDELWSDAVAYVAEHGGWAPERKRTLVQVFTRDGALDSEQHILEAVEPGPGGRPKTRMLSHLSDGDEQLPAPAGDPATGEVADATAADEQKQLRPLETPFRPEVQQLLRVHRLGPIGEGSERGLVAFELDRQDTEIVQERARVWIDARTAVPRLLQYELIPFSWLPLTVTRNYGYVEDCRGRWFTAREYLEVDLRSPIAGRDVRVFTSHHGLWRAR